MVILGKGVLALEGVLEESEEHVGAIDENIGAEHAFPEVPRITHLGEEVEEQHGSTISVDDGIETLVSTEETGATRGKSVRWSASELPDRNRAFNGTVGKVRVTIWSSSTTVRGEHSRIIRARVSTHADSDKGTRDGRPDGQVGQPAEPLQRTNLANDHTEDGKDQEADDEAKAIAMYIGIAKGNLGDRSAVTEDQDSHQHDHLETLQNVDQMSQFGTEDTEEGLAEIAEWVTVGIHVHVDAPDVPAGNGGHEAKDGVESDTRPVASIGEGPSTGWLARSIRSRLNGWKRLTPLHWDPEYRW